MEQQQQQKQQQEQQQATLNAIYALVLRCDARMERIESHLGLPPLILGRAQPQQRQRQPPVVLFDIDLTARPYRRPCEPVFLDTMLKKPTMVQMGTRKRINDTNVKDLILWDVLRISDPFRGLLYNTLRFTTGRFADRVKRIQDVYKNKTKLHLHGVDIIQDLKCVVYEQFDGMLLHRCTVM